MGTTIPSHGGESSDLGQRWPGVEAISLPGVRSIQQRLSKLSTAAQMSQLCWPCCESEQTGFLFSPLLPAASLTEKPFKSPSGNWAFFLPE